MSLIFSGKTLDDCLEKASKELNITKDEIDYIIVKETNSIIGSIIQIEVNELKIESSNSDDSLIDEENNHIEINNNKDMGVNDYNIQIGARVENGKIIVVGNENQVKTESITIKTCRGIDLFINGNRCKEKMIYTLNEKDKIEYKSNKTEATRNAIVSVSEDKMEAYLSIHYIPEYTYKLKDKPTYRNLALKAIKIEGEYPEKYTVTELKDILLKNNITEGIIYKNLIQASFSGGNEPILVAEGTPAIDDTTSTGKILFDTEQKNIIDKDSNENIDYKNIQVISNVEEGQILAELIPGVTGHDGKNVHGEVIKKKLIRNKPMKVGKGCKIEGNKVIATKAGRPDSKSNIISVNSIYKIDNVDMKSGNITFSGDVLISGSVKEGMTVKSGNSLTIGKNVDVSLILAGGGITIKGNIIRSKILTGQVDMDQKIYVDKLNEYKENIDKLISSAAKLIEASKGTKRISELVKILIENRYLEIPKLSLGIITQSICLDNDKSELIDFIRTKMIGLNIFRINSLDDLEYLKELIENEIDFFEGDLIIQSDINLGYCQDSTVKATGSIIVSGRGEYVSKFSALKDIIFLRDDSVARGGILSSRGNIKLGTVGSPAGVNTKLEVLPDGIITAKIAYSNTIFCFGNRCRILERTGKNVKAYMKEDGEIVIDKFVL